MQGTFPQFDTGRQIDYERIWSEALFVFDTNVLLNLYRYREVTRGEMIDVLETLKGRIWIPYYVALEFQRNRLKVLAEQIAIFKDVRERILNVYDSLSKDLDRLNLDHRHSVIEVSAFLSSFSELINKFKNELDEKKNGQRGLSDADPIKQRIEELFAGRVGMPTNSQSDLDKIYKYASVRFDKRIPPGYMDRNKGQTDQSDFFHNGLIYQRKYGDYLIWRQTLDFCKENKHKCVILITDDAKEDWWWEIKSGGPKRLGPRPELIEEALVDAGISDFHMYRSETFLEHAQRSRRANVSEGAIKEVREVSRFSENERFSLSFLYVANFAVERWISSRFSGTVRPSPVFPDYIVDHTFERLGFEVRLLTNPNADFSRVRNLISRAMFAVEENQLDEFYILFVAPSMEIGLELLRRSEAWMQFRLPRPIGLVFGFVRSEDDGDALFIPLTEVRRPSREQGGPSGPPPSFNNG